MYRSVTIALLILLCSGSPAALALASVSSATACERLEAQRDRIYRQLRRPHGAARANQLHARLRELGSRIARDCR